MALAKATSSTTATAAPRTVADRVSKGHREHVRDARTAAALATSHARRGKPRAAREQVALARQQLDDARSAVADRKRADRNLTTRLATQEAVPRPRGGWRPRESQAVSAADERTDRADRSARQSAVLVARVKAEAKAAKRHSRRAERAVDGLNLGAARSALARSRQHAARAEDSERRLRTLPAVESPVVNPRTPRTSTVADEVGAARRAARAADRAVPANAVQMLLDLGARFGLRLNPSMGNAQTTGGTHRPGSLHYEGLAVDFGDANNSRARLLALADYALRHPQRFAEMYYAPAGRHVQDGRVVAPGPEAASHNDHIHIALRG